MKSSKKILFIHNGYSTFVKADYDILIKNYHISSYHYSMSKKILPNILNQAKLLFWLQKNIFHSFCIYIWFADYHSLLPVIYSKIFNKNSIIIVGGYDAVSIPELKYGVFYKKIRSFFARASYRITNNILPVDQSLILSSNYYISKNGLKIGIKYYIEDLKTNIITVPTGYDPQKWKKNKSIDKENIVLTIGKGSTYQTFRRKGFDFFLEIAKKMPEYTFMIIGLDDHIRDKTVNNSKNVVIHKFIPNEELVDYYSRAKVFCQFSLNEGLPNTLCEAMLCECIPVGSNVNGIPFAIDNVGYVINEPSIEKAIEAINNAMQCDEEMGKKARQRIIENFHIDMRKSKLNEIIENLS